MKKLLILSLLIPAIANASAIIEDDMIQPNIDNIALYEEFIDVYTGNRNNLQYVFETMELLSKDTQINMLKSLLEHEDLSTKERKTIEKQINKLKSTK